ncbi:MAG: DUF4386 domain-containing protein [Cytophagales bacterium]|nr:DUF4386 domain-containing protein [Cytophagales bacterium]
MNSSIVVSIETSPKTYARIGGFLYLVIIAAGFCSEFFFRGKLIVGGDPVATANNIMAAPGLWRIGIALEYICIICTIILAMIYYYLLMPVHKELNLLAAFFRMVSIPLQAIALVYLIDALAPLTKKEFLSSYTADQLYIMASLSIKSHSNGYSASLLILGFCFLIHGYLIFKSGFLPKALGILILFAGTGYITHCFIFILEPSLTKWTFPIMMLPVLAGEVSLSMWLLVKGVDVEKWKQKHNYIP